MLRSLDILAHAQGKGEGGGCCDSHTHPETLLILSSMSGSVGNELLNCALLGPSDFLGNQKSATFLPGYGTTLYLFYDLLIIHIIR